MRARVIRPDGTTEPVDVPEDTAEASAVICAIIGCRTLTVTRVIQPGPGSAGLDMWADGHSLITAGLTPNPAAEAIVAFLSRGQVRPLFAGAAVFTGGPGARAAATALTREHEEIITTIAAAIRDASAGPAGPAGQAGQPPADGSPA